MRLQIFLCDDLVIEILSWLAVKPLLRFMCVSKWFQSLISDLSFVKLHLRRSPKSANVLLRYKDNTLNRTFVFPCPLRSLFKNPLSRIAKDLSSGFDLQDDWYEVVGSCNGLVCLVAQSNKGPMHACMFILWNPATRRTFEVPRCMFSVNLESNDLFVPFGFGYDNVSDTYKVVTIIFTFSSEDGSLRSRNAKVCSVSDNNYWRNIQSFPADPNTMEGSGVYLNSTLNWIASAHEHDDSEITFDELVIVSLDLANETYTKLLLPRSLDGVHTDNNVPSVVVLKDCLSLYLHNPKANHFTIWQMKVFGDQESWTQMLNISIQDLQIDCMTRYLEPLCMFENDRILLIYYHFHELRAILYDAIDNTVQHNKISCNRLSVSVEDYVQSLISPKRY